MDPESDADQVMEFVGGLMTRLEGLQKKAFTYKSYQKNFKVCDRIARVRGSKYCGLGYCVDGFQVMYHRISFLPLHLI